ncbi:MAG: histidinol-phosphate transaminase [Pseudomonadota bacterium]
MKPQTVPTPLARIRRAPAYVPGRHGTHPDALVLSANENPLGPGQQARAAMKRALEDNHHHPAASYPDGSALALREAIAECFQLNPANLVCGAGSDELINVLALCYAGSGDEVLYSQYGFLMYPIAATLAGARPIAVPVHTDQLKLDVDAMLDMAGPRTKIVFIANPNNPTGSWLGHDDIIRLVEHLPPRCLLVIDEAYGEYAQGDPMAPNYRTALDLALHYPNLCVLRTFSKIHGLAGLRVGWGMMPEKIIQTLNRARSPFNVSSLAQIAAIAAIKDQDHIDHSRQINRDQRDRFSQRLHEMGIETLPSIGNFVLARFADEQRANACHSWLEKQHIHVRPMQAYGLRSDIRITVAIQSELDRLLDQLQAFLERENLPS